MGKLWLIGIVALWSLAAQAEPTAGPPLTLLNVSYDPTRELYADYNPLFVQYWKVKTGQDIVVTQSHGGSARQARAVMEGLRADVVTLALGYDIDAIAAHNELLPRDWRGRLPHDSVPYSSTVVFLVRKGNPRQVQDWNDLVKGDIQVITPNPKSSGGARWNYLAAWGYAWKRAGGNEDAARAFVTELFRHVPLLDAAARGATTSFAERGQGDVLIAWESEALFMTRAVRKSEFEIIYPSISIRAEPPVAVVEKNARRNRSEEASHAYLAYLYSAPAQEVIARHYYRPSDPAVAARHADLFPALPMLSIADFGGWEAAQAKHFAEGGVFDRIYTP